MAGVIDVAVSFIDAATDCDWVGVVFGNWHRLHYNATTSLKPTGYTTAAVKSTSADIAPESHLCGSIAIYLIRSRQ